MKQILDRVKKRMMKNRSPLKIGVITLFPEKFDQLESGLTGKAFKDNRVSLFLENLREHGEGAHKVVDDTPYGGGDGMILKAEPIEQALKSLLKKMSESIENTRRIYMCPSGDLWTQPRAEEMAIKASNESAKSLIFLCGRYGGVDERVLKKYFKERISVGPYILNGGETATLCVLESFIRLLPGVLGNSESGVMDSFSHGSGLEAPSYTRPREWSDDFVPDVLLSGDHKKIEDFRLEESFFRTRLWVKKAIKEISSIYSQLKK